MYRIKPRNITLSSLLNAFYFSFSNRISLISSDWLWTCNPSAWVSRVAGITGITSMHRPHPPPFLKKFIIFGCTVLRSVLSSHFLWPLCFVLKRERRDLTENEKSLLCQAVTAPCICIPICNLPTSSVHVPGELVKVAAPRAQFNKCVVRFRNLHPCHVLRDSKAERLCTAF